MEVWLEDHQILSDFGSSWTPGGFRGVWPPRWARGGWSGVPGLPGSPGAVCNDGERLKSKDLRKSFEWLQFLCHKDPKHP